VRIALSIAPECPRHLLMAMINALSYFSKHQTLDITGKESKNKQFMPIAGQEEYHGTDGPIHTSFNDYYEPFEEDFCTAAYEVGGKDSTLSDAWSGDHVSAHPAPGVG